MSKKTSSKREVTKEESKYSEKYENEEFDDKKSETNQPPSELGKHSTF